MLPGAGQGDRVLPARLLPDRERGTEGASFAVLGEDRGGQVPVRRAVDLRRVTVMPIAPTGTMCVRLAPNTYSCTINSCATPPYYRYDTNFRMILQQLYCTIVR